MERDVAALFQDVATGVLCARFVSGLTASIERTARAHNVASSAVAKMISERMLEACPTPLSSVSAAPHPHATRKKNVMKAPLGRGLPPGHSIKLDYHNMSHELLTVLFMYLTRLLNLCGPQAMAPWSDFCVACFDHPSVDLTRAAYHYCCELLRREHKIADLLLERYFDVVKPPAAVVKLLQRCCGIHPRSTFEKLDGYLSQKSVGGPVRRKALRLLIEILQGKGVYLLEAKESGLWDTLLASVGHEENLSSFSLGCMSLFMLLPPSTSWMYHHGLEVVSSASASTGRHSEDNHSRTSRNQGGRISSDDHDAVAVSSATATAVPPLSAASSRVASPADLTIPPLVSSSSPPQISHAVPDDARVVKSTPFLGRANAGTSIVARTEFVGTNDGDKEKESTIAPATVSGPGASVSGAAMGSLRSAEQPREHSGTSRRSHVSDWFAADCEVLFMILLRAVLWNVHHSSHTGSSNTIGTGGGGGAKTSRTSVPASAPVRSSSPQQVKASASSPQVPVSAAAGGGGGGGGDMMSRSGGSSSRSPRSPQRSVTVKQGHTKSTAGGPASVTRGRSLSYEMAAMHQYPSPPKLGGATTADDTSESDAQRSVSGSEQPASRDSSDSLGVILDGSGGGDGGGGGGPSNGASPAVVVTAASTTAPPTATPSAGQTSTPHAKTPSPKSSNRNSPIAPSQMNVAPAVLRRICMLLFRRLYCLCPWDLTVYLRQKSRRSPALAQLLPALFHGVPLHPGLLALDSNNAALHAFPMERSHLHTHSHSRSTGSTMRSASGSGRSNTLGFGLDPLELIDAQIVKHTVASLVRRRSRKRDRHRGRRPRQRDNQTVRRPGGRSRAMGTTTSAGAASGDRSSSSVKPVPLDLARVARLQAATSLGVQEEKEQSTASEELRPDSVSSDRDRDDKDKHTPNTASSTPPAVQQQQHHRCCPLCGSLSFAAASSSSSSSSSFSSAMGSRAVQRRRSTGEVSRDIRGTITSTRAAHSRFGSAGEQSARGSMGSAPSVSSLSGMSTGTAEHLAMGVGGVTAPHASKDTESVSSLDELYKDKEERVGTEQAHHRVASGEDEHPVGAGAGAGAGVRDEADALGAESDWDGEDLIEELEEEEEDDDDNDVDDGEDYEHEQEEAEEPGEKKGGQHAHAESSAELFALHKQIVAMANRQGVSLTLDPWAVATKGRRGAEVLMLRGELVFERMLRQQHISRINKAQRDMARAGREALYRRSEVIVGYGDADRADHRGGEAASGDKDAGYEDRGKEQREVHAQESKLTRSMTSPPTNHKHPSNVPPHTEGPSGDAVHAHKAMVQSLKNLVSSGPTAGSPMLIVQAAMARGRARGAAMSPNVPIKRDGQPSRASAAVTAATSGSTTLGGGAAVDTGTPTPMDTPPTATRQLSAKYTVPPATRRSPSSGRMSPWLGTRRRGIPLPAAAAEEQETHSFLPSDNTSPQDGSRRHGRQQSDHRWERKYDMQRAHFRAMREKQRAYESRLIKELNALREERSRISQHSAFLQLENQRLSAETAAAKQALSEIRTQLREASLQLEKASQDRVEQEALKETVSSLQEQVWNWEASHTAFVNLTLNKVHYERDTMVQQFAERCQRAEDSQMETQEQLHSALAALRTERERRQQGEISVARLQSMMQMQREQSSKSVAHLESQCQVLKQKYRDVSKKLLQTQLAQADAMLGGDGPDEAQGAALGGGVLMSQAAPSPVAAAPPKPPPSELQKQLASAAAANAARRPPQAQADTSTNSSSNFANSVAMGVAGLFAGISTGSTARRNVGMSDVDGETELMDTSMREEQEYQ